MSVFCFVMFYFDDILANLISLSLAFLAFGGNLVKTSTGFKTLSIQDEEIWQTLIPDDSVIIKDVRIISQDILDVNVKNHIGLMTLLLK